MLAGAEILFRNEDLTYVDVVLVKEFLVSVDKFHLTDARQQLTLRDRVEILIVFSHAATRCHRARCYKNYLVALRVEGGNLSYKVAHALHVEHAVRLGQNIRTYLYGYCHGWFLQCVNCCV